MREKLRSLSFSISASSSFSESCERWAREQESSASLAFSVDQTLSSTTCGVLFVRTAHGNLLLDDDVANCERTLLFTVSHASSALMLPLRVCITCSR
jgi:hypothetical protein